jgi:hypothetical protein
VAGYRYDTVSDSRDINSNPYTSGASDPFGSFSTDAQQMSIYATYAPSPPPAPPSNVGVPVITGSPQVGQALTTSDGTWSQAPTAYTYQWLRCDASGSNCGPISGATFSTYTVRSADVGSTLEASVTAFIAGSSVTATSAPTTAVPGPEATATFGQTGVGSRSDVFGADRKRVNKYVLRTNGTVTKLTVYLQPSGTDGQQAIKGIIYADSGGRPSALLAVSTELTFASTNTAGWYDLTFPAPLALGPGTYWIGILSGTSYGVAGYRYTKKNRSRDINSNPYVLGASDPFGSFATDNQLMSLYATYSAVNAGERDVHGHRAPGHKRRMRK